ncbi:MAG TPA: hypothetical protein VF410_12515 [Rhizomicrobium sp.]|jgi:hypothetical protein
MRFNKTIAAYAAGVATTFVAIAAGQAIGAAQNTSFDTITVHRINVVEPDGTLRMTISNRTQFPGIIVKGKQMPHTDRNYAAGMLFFNDEGTENGGLIFGGRSKDGHVESGGHLSFDQYEQDQVVNLEQTEENGKRVAGLSISDRPDAPMDFALMSKLESMPDSPEKRAQLEKLDAQGAFGQPRVFIGKNQDKDSRVNLKDAAGHTRLVLSVTASGAASIQFLDAAGKVIRTIAPGG